MLWLLKLKMIRNYQYQLLNQTMMMLAESLQRASWKSSKAPSKRLYNICPALTIHE
jgi:hypothetical protein